MATRYPYSSFGPGSSADPFALLHEEMDRLLGQTLSRLGSPAGARDGVMAAAPRMDVAETEGAFFIELDVPGVAREDIELTLEGDVLTIRGQRKPKARGDEKEKRTLHLGERPVGSFVRTLQLPFAAEMEQCNAALQDGVLTITLAKSDAQRRSRRIEIRGAQDEHARTPLEHGQTEILDAEQPAKGKTERASMRAEQRQPGAEQRAH